LRDLFCKRIVLVPLATSIAISILNADRGHRSAFNVSRPARRYTWKRQPELCQSCGNNDAGRPIAAQTSNRTRNTAYREASEFIESSSTFFPIGKGDAQYGPIDTSGRGAA
jgi:hypothetical protein